jgi:hypothetical protein
MKSHKKMRGSRPPWKAVVGIATVIVAISAVVYRCGTRVSGYASDKPARQSQGRTTVPPYYSDVRGVVLPKTLQPDGFPEGKVRYAYQVAERIPQVLAQIPCYCPCDRIGHKSLLHCYADQHAAYCDICQDSALWAEKRSNERARSAAIREEIVAQYSDSR